MAIIPSGATNRLIARLAQQHGGRLIDQAVTRLLPNEPGPRGPGKNAPVDQDPPKTPISHRLVGMLLTRVALRSVPGAILVGGGLIAKSIYDHRQQTRARRGR